MKSIKTKLISYILVLILAVSLSVGFMSLRSASRAITTEAENGLRTVAEEGARLVSSRVETQIRSLEILAGIEDIRSMDWDLQQPMLNRQVNRTNFLAFGIVLPDGTTYYNDGTTANLGDRDYVQTAFNGESNVSDIMVSGVTNDIVMMYATPIEQEGQVVGVLVGRRDGIALSNVTDTMGYGETGYAYTINNEGIVVGHNNRDYVSNRFDPINESSEDTSLIPLASLFNQILEERTGVNGYNFDGNDLYAGYSPIEGTDWVIVVVANQEEVLQSIPALTRNITTLVLIILVASTVFIYFIGSSISNPIVKIKDLAVKLSNLNISENIDEKLLNSKDEIGELAKSLQVVTESFRDIISDIQESADQVAASSEELTATSQQSTVSAEEVARTVEQIAKGAAQQAKNTEEGSLKASQLGDIIEKDLAYVENLNNASKNVSEVVDEGLKEIENLTRIAKESDSETQAVQKGIIRTNDSANKIGEASNVIAAIAAQTNLLALNAAIEAARAGEHGKGFSVVAEEIRKLAEQSTESTKTIDTVVQELQNNSKTAVETMEKVTTILKEQILSIQASKSKYLSIDNAMKEAELEVEKLNSSGGKMEEMKNDIISLLQNLSAIAEENSASTEEVSASMEEQSASIEEISGSSEGLSDLAQSLQSIIKRFKV